MASAQDNSTNNSPNSTSSASGGGGSNDSWTCPQNIPDANHFFKDLPTVDVVFISLGVIVTFIIFVLYFELVFRHFPNRSRNRQRIEGTRPAWILSVFPLISLCAVVSVCVPRTGYCNDLIAAIFLAISLFKFYRLVVGYYGGPVDMLEQLKDKICSLRGPPCCCCCYCLPGVIIDKTALKFCHWFVIQVCIITPVGAYILTVMSLDGYLSAYENSASMIIVRDILILSTLLAEYGLLLMHRISRDPLHHEGLETGFMVMIVTMAVFNIQLPLLHIFLYAGVVKCTRLLSALTYCHYIHHHVIIWEMLVLMIIARKFFVDRNSKRAYVFQQKNVETGGTKAGAPPPKAEVEGDGTTPTVAPGGPEANNTPEADGGTDNVGVELEPIDL